MLESIIKAVVFLVILINISLSHLYLGYQIGSDETVPFWVSHADPAIFLARQHSSIFLLSLVLLIFEVIGKRAFWRYLSITLLVLISFLYKSVYLQKSLTLGEHSTLGNLIRDTFVIDWISFTLVLILVVLQLVHLKRSSKTA
jgi:formate-dependent nitrite reductase membrane component NrfD